jgi:bacillopeptidase F (M6 metalloprotease family)
MFNSERNYWAGNISGYESKAMGAPMSNAYFVQLRGGVKPVDKLDIMASLSWAKMHRADGLSLGVQAGRDYGWEVDVTGTYKITNNLSYMLGGGYWFVGKYYKGSGAPGHELKNDFLVINKLTLTF